MNYQEYIIRTPNVYKMCNIYFAEIESIKGKNFYDILNKYKTFLNFEKANRDRINDMELNRKLYSPFYDEYYRYYILCQFDKSEYYVLYAWVGITCDWGYVILHKRPLIIDSSDSSDNEEPKRRKII